MGPSEISTLPCFLSSHLCIIHPKESVGTISLTFVSNYFEVCGQKKHLIGNHPNGSFNQTPTKRDAFRDVDIKAAALKVNI